MAGGAGKGLGNLFALCDLGQMARRAAPWWSADEDAAADDGVDQAFGAEDFDGFLDGADSDAVPLGQRPLAGDRPPGGQFAGFDLSTKDGGQLLVDRHGAFMIDLGHMIKLPSPG